MNRSAEEKALQFWMLLEAERHDLSYKRRSPEPEPQVVYVTKPARENKKAREKRDKLFYDAGRFAGGATDQTAIRADEELQKLLEKEANGNL